MSNAYTLALPHPRQNHGHVAILAQICIGFRLVTSNELLEFCGENVLTDSLLINYLSHVISLRRGFAAYITRASPAIGSCACPRAIVANASVFASSSFSLHCVTAVPTPVAFHGDLSLAFGLFLDRLARIVRFPPSLLACIGSLGEHPAAPLPSSMEPFLVEQVPP